MSEWWANGYCACGEPVRQNRARCHGAYGKKLVTCGKLACQRKRKTQLQHDRRLREATTIDVASV